MRQLHDTLTVQTRGRDCYEISHDAAQFVTGTGIQSGLLTLLVMHTSASLTIQENADPDVQTDLLDVLSGLAPEGRGLYRHSAEGPDDMPAHIKAALTDVSLSIPVMNGAMRLGTWQGIYLLEHRTRPHIRKVALQIMGE